MYIKISVQFPDRQLTNKVSVVLLRNPVVSEIILRRVSSDAFLFKNSFT
jgi:hypothetical protein